MSSLFKLDRALLAIVAFAMGAGMLPQLTSIAKSEDAASHFYNGNKLHELCETYPLAALYYVTGTMDGVWVEKNNVLTLMACLPPNLTALQAKDVTCQYLKSNPGKRHYTASSVVYTALSVAFPCTSR